MEDVYKTTDRLNRFNEHGEEILNPTPMQPPLGYVKAPSLLDTIRQQIRAHHLANLDMEPESEEEADDFDIPDDPVDPTSRWENDMVPSIKETRKRVRELEAAERLFARAPQPGQANAEAGDGGPPQAAPLAENEPVVVPPSKAGFFG